MLKCSKCGKEVDHVADYSYGLDHGEVFYVVLCDDCKNVSEDEYKNLKEKSLNEKHE